jgi:putative ABC transport system substrate-binding protein
LIHFSIFSSACAALTINGDDPPPSVVFGVGVDPVQFGLVASLNRPGGNMTGVAALSGELAAKRLELLHELLPTAAVIALLVNPTNPYTEPETREARGATRSDRCARV